MFVFPAHLFKPQTVRAHVVGRVISGGESLAGDEDVIAADGGGRWVIEYGGINLRTVEQQRAWEAWLAYLESGATTCLVPLLSVATAPRPMVGARPLPVSELVADDPLYPTSVTYAAPIASGHVDATALLRATSLSIAMTHGPKPVGGERFSVDGRAYRIVRKTGASTYHINPPLREPLTSGTELEFGYPVVRARQMVDNDAAALINALRFTSGASIAFKEAP